MRYVFQAAKGVMHSTAVGAGEKKTVTAHSTKNIPTHLTHKPVIGCNYDGVVKRVPGKCCDYSDARYISIGHAQYNREEASVKVMRHTGKKWSRQSEEVPIQRLPYMMIMLLAAIYKIQNPNEEGSCSKYINEEIVAPDDMEHLRSEVKNWANYLKDGIEGIKDLLSRIDVSKIGK